MSRILLFGGTFDPIHVAHLIVARAVAERLSVDRLVLLPARLPPHKQDHTISDAAHRLAMCRLAVEGDATFSVDEWELHQSGPSYTIQTVERYRAEFAPKWCGWLIGMDSLVDLPTWHRVSELVDACTLVTARRPGVALPDFRDHERLLSAAQIDRLRRHVVTAPEIEVSASDVRQRVREGRSIRYLVPASVDAYIVAQGLYQD